MPGQRTRGDHRTTVSRSPENATRRRGSATHAARSAGVAPCADLGAELRRRCVPAGASLSCVRRTGCRAHTRSAPADSRESVPAGELTTLGVATAGARKNCSRMSGPPADVAVPKVPIRDAAEHALDNPRPSRDGKGPDRHVWSASSPTWCSIQPSSPHRGGRPRVIERYQGLSGLLNAAPTLEERSAHYSACGLALIYHREAGTEYVTRAWRNVACRRGDLSVCDTRGGSRLGDLTGGGDHPLPTGRAVNRG